MYRLLLFLIMVLLLVVLLLTISILTILLLSAVILLRPLLTSALKKKKLANTNDRKSVPKGSPRTEAASKSQGMKTQERRAGQYKEHGGEKRESSFHNTDQYIVSNRYDNMQNVESQDDQAVSAMESIPGTANLSQDRELMQVVNGVIKNNDIILKSLNGNAKQQIGVKQRFTDATDGKLVIYKTWKDLYYVVPCKRRISAKDYEVGDIGACFEFDIQLSDGKQYEIIGVNKACRMTMDEEGYYTIVKKGELILGEAR